MKIILATHNIHKMVEMKAVLKDFQVDVLTLDDFPEIGEIPETGETLEENALLKARTVNKLSGFPAVGDDTGLEVNALDGDPGVYSARYAGENVTYSNNVNKLLSEMINKNDRSAQFRTVTAFVDGEDEIIAEGKIDGLITKEPKGNYGFGYDPVFYIPKMKRTFAELSAEEKNRISHRGLALQKLCKLLSAHWSENKPTGD
ncbi:MAG: RdgB/HAM1 family non-canonical purine NTP pyrophosphatase [Candidatus Marinimicrobia bacterium]|nr:RdgB/HAM1 family non-canonical purine NTP pyrophosphatase [Candidatus Neomarinimicrobiota bacterium]